MAKGFPIYSDLIIKLDPKNVNMVQAQLKQTLSSGSLSIDIAKPIGLKEYEDALKRVRRESIGLMGDMQSLGERTTRVFARFSAYLLASGGILASITLMKDAIGQALKFNSELIRIKQVSGDSNIAIGKLADEVGRLSKTLGVSSSELIKSAVTLKQAGLSVKDTTKALETLAQAELAPNFDSMAKTTEGLIAIYQQFGKDIDKVKTQLGSLNAVAGEFAVEASDLITVVQKAGGAASSSGAKLEELLALFTSVRATTRESADSIATGLRTIFGRLQRPETIKFLDELGIKMRYTAEEAKAAGKNVGDFVGPFQAILRISAGTANMGTGSTLFSNLVEQIGGLRQISRVVPLIKESSLAVEAWNVALAGQNSLYINSLQKQDDYLIRLKKIQETFLDMGRNFIKTDGFKDLAAVLGAMAKAAIQLTDALGPLLPYLAQLLVINTAMGAAKSLIQGIGTSVGIRDIPSQKKMATGGIVPGSGSGDKVPALLEPGEAVIPKNQVSRFPSFINQLISGGVKGFAKGGVVGSFVPDDDDFKKALIAFAKKNKMSPEGLYTDYIFDPKLMSNSHPGRFAKGRASSSGQLQLNPTQFSSRQDFYETVAHELGHFVDRKRNISTSKQTQSYLSTAESIKEYEEYARSAKQSFAPQGPMGIPYAMKTNERVANAFAMGDMNVVNPTDADKKAAAQYIKKNQDSLFARIGRSIGSALVSEKPVPSAPGFTPLSQGLSGAFGGITPPALPKSIVPTYLPNLARNSKQQDPSDFPRNYRGFGGRITKPKGKIDETIFNNFIDEDKNVVTFQQKQRAAELQKLIARQQDTINELELGRKQGRNGGTGANAQAYRDDIGKYLAHLRDQQKNLGNLKTELKNVGQPGHNPYSVSNIMKNGGLGTFGTSGLGSGGGWEGWQQSKSVHTINNKPTWGSWWNNNWPPGGGGGGGGRGGGGGGGGPPNNPPPNPPDDITVDRASKDYKRSRFWGGAASIAGVGIPLALGYGAAYSEDEQTKTRFGAAATFSGMGAGVGSLFGPAGILVGAAAGAIYGWFNSGAEAAKDAAKKLQAKRLDESVEKLNQALEDLSEGRGSVKSLAEGLSSVRDNALKNAQQNLKPGENLFEKSQEEFQKIAGINLAKYQKLINNQLKKQAESGQGPLLQGEFEDIAKNIVEIRQRKGERFTMQNYENDLKEVYGAYSADKARKDADLRFVQQIDASVHSAKSFSDAVQKAADAATEMDKKISVLTSGGYATPSLALGEYGSINQANLSSLSSFGGGMFSGLTSQVSGANQAAKYLPEVLSRIIKPGEGSNTDTSVSGAFEEAFNNIAKQTGEKFDKKVLSVLSNKLESMKTEDLFENFKKAPEQFADEMIKSFEPALKALESIGKNLQTRDEAYQRGLSQLKEMNNRRNELFAQKSSMGIGIADIGDEISNNSLGIKQIPRFSNARNAFVSEQQRLAPGLDVSTIGDAITKEKANLRALQEKATEEARAASGSKIFADKVLESENRLNNLNKALSNLTNRSEELSRLQARRSELEARIEGKIGLAKSFYSSDRQGLLEMNRNFGSAQALRIFGPDKIRQRFGIDFGSDVFRRGMSTLEGTLGDVVLEKRKVKNKDGKTEEVEYTGKMIAQEILMKQLGIKGVSPVNERKQIEEILKEMKNISSEGSTAVDIMLTDLNNAELELYKNLKANNDSFTENLNKLIDELSNNARVAETAKDRTRLNEIEKEVKAGDEVIGSKLDINVVRDNIKAIKAARQAKGELTNVEANAEKNAAKAEFFIRQNIDKMSPEELVDKMPGDFDTNQKASALRIVKQMKESKHNPEVERLVKERDKNAWVDSVDESGKPMKRLMNKIDNEYLKAIDEARKRTYVPPELRGQLKGIQTQDTVDKFKKTRLGLAPGTQGAIDLSDDALKLIESKKDPSVLQKENFDLQRKINENQNRIREFEAAKADRAAQQQQKQQQEQQFQQRQMQQQPIQLPGAPIPQISAPGPSRFAPRRGDTPLGPELGAMGSKLDKTFTDFSANVGKQVEALAAIPRVIEMNVKQTVEVIVNGAGALAMLEPTMKKVADAAVIKGIETIGGQLRAANIKINYNPSADGGAA